MIIACVSEIAFISDAPANVFENGVRITLSGNCDHLVFVLLHDRPRVLMEREQALFNGLQVVVSATAGPSPADQTLSHDLIADQKADQKRTLRHVFFEPNRLLDLQLT